MKRGTFGAARFAGGPRKRSAGFTMIEVLIALVVLAIGLLGLALLQTMTLRYTQSANLRSQAIDLAGELLDMVRVNRSEAASYAAITEASFDSVTPPVNGCAAQDSLSSTNNITHWKCEVRERLGADAKALVTWQNNILRVQVSWTDSHWESDAARRAGSVVLETRL